MKNDPIVAEIREIRERRAAKFNFDIRAIAEDAMKRERSGGREVVAIPKTASE